MGILKKIMKGIKNLFRVKCPYFEICLRRKENSRLCERDGGGDYCGHHRKLSAMEPNERLEWIASQVQERKIIVLVLIFRRSIMIFLGKN